MRLPIIAVLLAASSAAADPIAGCPAREAITLGTRVAAKLHTTYELPLVNLRVCIDKATYPYAAGRGHRLHACFVIADAKTSKRYCGDGDMFTDVGRHRVVVSLRTRRFTGSSDVWLQIDPRP